ncbi:Gdi1 [Symbiodinium sp. KB8]|nr:Gdi1 [Symbiodinium sp. KB8]
MPGSAPPKELGENREWNVDLIPKFIMASGDLVKILLKTKVSRYLEWKSCEGTYVYQYQEAGLFSGAKYIHKVPATATDGLKSPLMGMLEKPRFINFAQFIMNWEDDKPGTHQDIDPRRHTMAQVYQKFGLQESTIDFIGHAVALHPNDSYLNGPCGPTIQKCRLYLQSVLQYGGSPFIYPIYGLGGLPEGFSRLAAIHRGTYMLNKSVDGFVYDDAGKVQMPWGYCERGPLCNFLHPGEGADGGWSDNAAQAFNAAEAWSPDPRKRMSTSEGQGPMAKRHKSVPCRHYSRGFCQLGDSCNFLHEPSLVVGPPLLHEPSLVVGPPRVVPPPTRQAGTLPTPVADPVAAAEGAAAEQAPQNDLGEMAQSVAPAGGRTYKKSKLCIHHTNGYCSRGYTCNFAHGEHELGTPQPSADAGWAAQSAQQDWQSNGWQSNGWQPSNWQSNGWQPNAWQGNDWQKLGLAFCVKGDLSRVGFQFCDRLRVFIECPWSCYIGAFRVWRDGRTQHVSVALSPLPFLPTSFVHSFVIV